MRFYQQQHRFYAGVDLHARTMYVCVLDQTGAVVFDSNLAAEPDRFRSAIAPFRESPSDLVVCCECMFAWYWLADLCAAEGIPFVLGHALAMKAIHGGKQKNDRIDAHKIAALLRGGLLPQAYVYPKAMRATRDLLRRRMFLMHKRAEAIAHIQNTNSQYNLPAFGQKLVYAANREELHIAERFSEPSVKRMVEVDLALIEHLDQKEVAGEEDQGLRQAEGIGHPHRQAGPLAVRHALQERAVRCQEVLGELRKAEQVLAVVPPRHTWAKTVASGWSRSS